MTPCRFDDLSPHVSFNVPVEVPLNVPFHRPVSGDDEPAGGEVATAAGVVWLVVVVGLEFELQATAARTSTAMDADRRSAGRPRRSLVGCSLRIMPRPPSRVPPPPAPVLWRRAGKDGSCSLRRHMIELAAHRHKRDGASSLWWNRDGLGKASPRGPQLLILR